MKIFQRKIAVFQTARRSTKNISKIMICRARVVFHLKIMLFCRKGHDMQWTINYESPINLNLELEAPYQNVTRYFSFLHTASLGKNCAAWLFTLSPCIANLNFLVDFFCVENHNWTSWHLKRYDQCADAEMDFRKAILCVKFQVATGRRGSKEGIRLYMLINEL